MADDDVQSIFDLEVKINGLKDWARQAGRKDLDSFRKIEKSAGVVKETLQSSMTARRMSVGNQEKLATAFGFHINWIEWRDPSPRADSRRDSAKAFLEKFLTHKSTGTSLTINAGLTTSKLDRRFANFAFDSAGSLETTSNANELPLRLTLSFDERGLQVTPDLKVGLKQVDIELSHERQGASLKAIHLSHDNESNGNFEGEARGTGKEHVYWVIKGVGGDQAWLAGWRRPNHGQDCICQGFGAGDEIHARMTANAHDCFVAVTGKPLTDNQTKKRFIEHLAKLAVLEGTEATLGEQILMVVQKS